MASLQEPEVCDHRDDFGSAIWTDRTCILCSREIPFSVEEAKAILNVAVEREKAAKEGLDKT